MNAMLNLPTWMQTVAYPQAPAWLQASRQQHWDAVSQCGLPTRKHEAWKYADLSFLDNKYLATPTKLFDPQLIQQTIEQHRLSQDESILFVFVNGYFIPALSDIQLLPKDAIACELSIALQEHATLIEKNWLTVDAKKYPFASLNAAMFLDGLFLSIPNRCEIKLPIQLLHIASDQQAFTAHPRHMILLGEQSKVNVLEEYISLTSQTYFQNTVSTIMLGKEAQLEHCKIQTENNSATHLAHIFVTQLENSNTTFTNFSYGALFGRDELVVKLLGAGADCRTGGFYRLQTKDQYIDNHIDINHAAPNSNSEMLFKGTVDNKARAVFNGRLHVAKDAQKIVAYQANHNLLLSNLAEVYSKPELEIYADDVKCKHGATTGQLDQDALFYMRSRGIPEREALDILLRGFADEVLQRVTHPLLRKRAQELI